MFIALHFIFIQLETIMAITLTTTASTAHTTVNIATLYAQRN